MKKRVVFRFFVNGTEYYDASIACEDHDLLCMAQEAEPNAEIRRSAPGSLTGQVFVGEKIIVRR